MARREGSMTNYHVVSTNANKIAVDQVTTEDILSILKALVDKYGSDDWLKLIDALYKHIIDFNNPHQFTIEQLDQRVIEVVYGHWITEGYKGSLNDFMEIFFQWVEIAELTDMDLIIAYAQSDNPDHIKWLDGRVPSVAVLAAYIRWHNENLKAHEEQFNKIFGSVDKYPSIDIVPSFGITRIAGVGLPGYARDYESGTSLKNCPVKSHHTEIMGILIQLYVGSTSVSSPKRIRVSSYTNPDSIVGTKPTVQQFRHIDIITNAAGRINVACGYVENTTASLARLSSNNIRRTANSYMNLYCQFNADSTTTLFYLQQDEVETLTKIQIASKDLRLPIQDTFYVTIDDLKGFEHSNANKPRCLGCFGYNRQLTDAQIAHMLNINWKTPN